MIERRPLPRPLLLAMAGVSGLVLWFAAAADVAAPAGLLPHGICLLWDMTLLRLHIISDVLISGAYLFIGLALLAGAFRYRSRLVASREVTGFGAFIFCCGLTHVMGIVTLYIPVYWLEGGVKALTALASVWTAFLIPGLLRLIGQLVQAREERDRLRAEQDHAIRSLQQMVGEQETDLVLLTLERNRLLNRHRALAEHFPGGIALFTAEARYELVDGHAVRTHMPDALQLVGQPVGAYATGGGPDLHTAALATLAGEEQRYSYRHGGRSYRGHMTPIREEDGTISGGLAVLLDVTEQEEALAALADREARLQRLLDAAPIGILQVDSRGRIIEANPAISTLVQRPTDELRGLSVFSFTHPEDVETDQRMFAEVLQGRRERYTLEKRYVRPDGSPVWVEVYCTPIPAATGEPALLLRMALDLTARRALETQVVQAQKMEGVGRLAGGIAHDFNNMMTVIQGLGEFVRAELPDGSRAAADMDEVLRTASRATALAKQILSVARQGMLEVRATDLADLVRRAVAMLRPLVGEQIALEVHAPAGLPWIRCDAGQVEQVLINLVVNARDAIFERGQAGLDGVIEVHLEERELDGAEHSYVQPGRYVRLCVKDNGKGMSPDTLEHIFEPFYTTKPRGKGTGLGLAVSYGIVKQHAGYIWASSTPGKGTRLEVFFPVTPEDGGPRNGEGAEALPRGRGERVLIVEDEEGLRNFAARVLSGLGYHVELAVNGAEALLQLLTLHSRGQLPALVFSDVIMPRMGGVSLRDTLAEQYPDIRVLLTSGYADNTITQAGLFQADAGLHFLPKPYTARDLARRVRAVLEWDDHA